MAVNLPVILDGGPVPAEWYDEVGNLLVDLDAFVLNPAGAIVSRSTDQPVANITHTSAQWTSEDFDAFGMVNLGVSSTRVNILHPGKWDLGALIALASGTGQIEISILKNGDLANYLVRNKINMTNVVDDYMSIFCPTVPLVAGDYIEVDVWHNSGVSRNLHRAALAAWRRSE